MSSHEVIYLTGPPATGKTTLVTRLTKAFPSVRAFIYSQLLSEHITRQGGRPFSQESLRRKSGHAVSPEDILAVDRYLIREVAKARRTQHILVDSHPVTKEGYGFRVTAFSIPFLRSLRPSRICMLFTSSKSVIRRIKRDPKGRPAITPFEADFHCFAQMSVAVAYGIQLGLPIYFYDTSADVETAFKEIAKRIA